MDLEILQEDTRFFINDQQGNTIAEISFVPSGDRLTIIDHTWVDETLKGQGVGKELVARVVKKNAPGRPQDYSAVPICQT